MPMGTESEQIRDALVTLAIFALLTHHVGQRDRRLGITTTESYRAIAVFVITAAWDVVLRHLRGRATRSNCQGLELGADASPLFS